jgi:hypothetical protein
MSQDSNSAYLETAIFHGFVEEGRLFTENKFVCFEYFALALNSEIGVGAGFESPKDRENAFALLLTKADTHR